MLVPPARPAVSWAALSAAVRDEDPALFGFPFFYWYQFAWVPLTAGITYFVYRKTWPAEPTERLPAEPSGSASSPRRRPVHGLHVHRRAGARLGRRRGGFFALPYTILVFPLVFLVMPRLWSVASKHKYVTAADYVKGRYSSRSLASAIAFTGLLATMPYIAAAARRHPGGARGARHRGRMAARHRLRDPRRLHLHEPTARAGDDRARKRHADLRDRDRRGDLHPVEARRLGRDLLVGGERAAEPRRARRARSVGCRRPGGLRHARAGVGDGALPLPARADRRAELALAGRGAAQHVAAAGVDLPARADGTARLRGDRRRSQRQRAEQRGTGRRCPP